MKKLSLDAFSLKIIALIAMSIDHYGYFIAPDQIIYRIIGRISFVIFAYFIANGYFHTSNKLKHGLMLLGFGIIIDLVMYLTNNYEYSNIFITLAFGYFVIYGFDNKKYFISILFLGLAYFINMDYGYYGIIMIFLSYIYYNDLFRLVLYNIILSFLFITFGNFSYIQYYSLFGVLLLFLYNGKRGLKVKYLFYIYYPAHVILLNYIAMNLK